MISPARPSTGPLGVPTYVILLTRIRQIAHLKLTSASPTPTPTPRRSLRLPASDCTRDHASPILSLFKCLCQRPWAVYGMRNSSSAQPGRVLLLSWSPCKGACCMSNQRLPRPRDWASWPVPIGKARPQPVERMRTTGGPLGHWVHRQFSKAVVGGDSATQ